MQRALSLIGHLEPDEAVAYMRTHYEWPEGTADAYLQTVWAGAHTYATASYPRAGQPNFLPVMDELSARMPEQRVALVEIGPLLALQMEVDLERVQRFAGSIPGELHVRGFAAELCLPLEPVQSRVQAEIDARAVTLTSPDANLRWTSISLDSDEAGAALKVRFGLGVPYVVVSPWRGRYVLRNGYHRAVALLKAGQNHMPAVVEESPGEDWLPAGPSFFTAAVLNRPTPPVVAHYLLDVAVPVHLTPTVKVLRLVMDEFTVKAK